MNEIKMANLLAEFLKPYFAEISLSGISSFLCVLAEEWCKIHGVDAPTFMQGLADMVKQTNETEGPY